MRFWTTDWSYNDFFNRLECSVNFAMKLSVKGFEQASERGFGRCSVPKSAHPDPREAPVRAPPGLFRQFLYGVLGSSHPEIATWHTKIVNGGCVWIRVAPYA